MQTLNEKQIANVSGGDGEFGCVCYPMMQIRLVNGISECVDFCCQQNEATHYVMAPSNNKYGVKIHKGQQIVATIRGECPSNKFYNLFSSRGFSDMR